MVFNGLLHTAAFLIYVYRLLRYIFIFSTGEIHEAQWKLAVILTKLHGWPEKQNWQNQMAFVTSLVSWDGTGYRSPDACSVIGGSLIMSVINKLIVDFKPTRIEQTGLVRKNFAALSQDNKVLLDAAHKYPTSPSQAIKSLLIGGER